MDQNLNSARPAELLDRLTAELCGSVEPEEARSVRRFLDTTMEAIRQQIAMTRAPSEELFRRNPPVRLASLPADAVVAAQGVAGAYSHIACERLFGSQNMPEFYAAFEDVFTALEQGRADFGVLPIENSTAGAVSSVVESVSRHRCYISAMEQLPVQHCLCAHPDSDPAQIATVYSHPQALAQCRDYLRRHGYRAQEASNTAVAAQQVAGAGASTMACICSERGASLYGLRILSRGVQDFSRNYTRFICLSPRLCLLPGADTISVALSFPNEVGALARLLSQFALFDLDLTKIQSLPIGGGDFHVRFHLDFRGSLEEAKVQNLLGHMYAAFEDFQFLGCYRACTNLPATGEMHANSITELEE